jgi:hypothetical protein
MSDQADREACVPFYMLSAAPHAFEDLAPDSDLAKEYLAKARSWLKEALKA